MQHFFSDECHEKLKTVTAKNKLEAEYHRTEMMKLRVTLEHEKKVRKFVETKVNNREDYIWEEQMKRMKMGLNLIFIDI